MVYKILAEEIEKREERSLMGVTTEDWLKRMRGGVINIQYERTES